MKDLTLNWRTKGGEVKNIEDLTDQELNEAYIQAQKVYYKAHKTMMKMDMFIERFEIEAEEREKDLVSYTTKTKDKNIKEFFKNEEILSIASSK